MAQLTPKQERLADLIGTLVGVAVNEKTGRVLDELRGMSQCLDRQNRDLEALVGLVAELERRIEENAGSNSKHLRVV
jgi:hypothetical protein